MLKKCGYSVFLFLSFLAISQVKQARSYFDADSTKVMEIYNYSRKDSTLQGSYESFYLNGSLKSYGWFTKNEPDGVWNYYYENGRKKAEGKFKAGIPKGIWTYYFENGNVKSKGTLDGSLKEGVWIFYYENDGEKSKGTFANNQKIGVWNYFYEDGSLKAQSVIEQRKGSYVEFYPSGSRRMEGVNVNDKSEGEWIYYFESGEIEAIGHYKNGRKSGDWVYYHKNGQEAAKGIYEDGNRQGEWQYFHENGNLSQKGNLINDQKDGYWKLFYPTGEILGEVAYDGKDEMVNEYYPSGSQKSKGQLVDGNKTGKWYYYSEQGYLEGEADLNTGRGTYIGYYPDGSTKMSGEIEDDKRVGEWQLYNPDGSTAGTYRPIYENEQPVFKPRVTSDYVSKDSQDKPNYHPEKRGLRYFLPRVNEYRGFIIGTNPFWLLDDQLPVAVEYYIQERLGHELQIDIIRSPFFIPDEDIADYQIYRREAQFHFRQKFYHTDSKLGMFYFGHEVNFKYVNSQVNHLDTLIVNATVNRFGNLVETSYGYGVFLGNRWMKDAGSSGLTVDTFIGIGISGRSFDKQYEPIQVLDNYFNREIKSSVYFPVIFGINVGFALTKSRSKTQ